MTWGFGLSMRNGCVLQDITLTVELKRLVEALFLERWNSLLNAARNRCCPICRIQFEVSHR